jgi:antitoxin (DNA-binding transcriptional repressor) of toxin-antitoxin stability system
VAVLTKEAAMRTVGVDELEDHLADVLDQMRETGEVVAVIKGDEVIAHLVPANIPQWLAEVPSGDAWANLDRVKTGIDAHRAKNTDAVEAVRTAWANFDRLVTELGVHWPEDVSAVDAVRDVRREL